MHGSMMMMTAAPLRESEAVMNKAVARSTSTVQSDEHVRLHMKHIVTNSKLHKVQRTTAVRP